MIDEKVLYVAMAIEGPWYTDHLTCERVMELRSIRWDMLSNQDRGVRLQEAHAAITAMENTP